MMDMSIEINFAQNQEYMLICFVAIRLKVKRKKEIFTNLSLVIWYSHVRRRALSSDRHINEKIKLNLVYAKFFFD